MIPAYPIPALAEGGSSILTPDGSLLFIVILLAIPGSQILIYPILWILMPSEKPAYVSAYPPAV